MHSGSHGHVEIIAPGIPPLKTLIPNGPAASVQATLQAQSTVR
jgi:hypothetical protein